MIFLIFTFSPRTESVKREGIVFYDFEKKSNFTKMNEAILIFNIFL